MIYIHNFYLRKCPSDWWHCEQVYFLKNTYYTTQIINLTSLVPCQYCINVAAHDIAGHHNFIR